MAPSPPPTAPTEGIGLVRPPGAVDRIVGLVTPISAVDRVVGDCAKVVPQAKRTKAAATVKARCIEAPALAANRVVLRPVLDRL
jgi:hypothetical protein